MQRHHEIGKIKSELTDQVWANERLWLDRSATSDSLDGYYFNHLEQSLRKTARM